MKPHYLPRGTNLVQFSARFGNGVRSSRVGIFPRLQRVGIFPINLGRGESHGPRPPVTEKAKPPWSGGKANLVLRSDRGWIYCIFKFFDFRTISHVRSLDLYFVHFLPAFVLARGSYEHIFVPTLEMVRFAHFLYKPNIVFAFYSYALSLSRSTVV